MRSPLAGKTPRGSKEVDHSAVGSAVGHQRERGSVTAEFAAAVPAVVLVLAFCLGGTQLGAQQVRVQDAAADAARALARGDPDVAAGRAVSVGASLTVSRPGDLICAELSAAAAGAIPLAGAIPVRAASCALEGGR